MEVNLSDATPFPKSCDDFLGAFWGVKIVKTKITLKILEHLQRKS